MSETMRKRRDHSASPISGLKPFLLAGLVVVVGLLVGLNLMMKNRDSSDQMVTESVLPAEGELVPGEIKIHPDVEMPAQADEPSSSSAPDVTGPISPSDFTFYETLKKSADEPLGTVDLSAKPNTATKSEPPAKPVAKPVPKPASKPTRARLIETAPVNSDTLHYTVQVAAFRQQEMAEELKARLAKKGHDAYLMTATLPDGMTYRVRVGHYASRDEATRTARHLAEQEGFHPFVATVQPNS